MTDQMINSLSQADRLLELASVSGDQSLAKELGDLRASTMARLYPDLSISQVRGIAPGKIEGFLNHGNDMDQLRDEIKKTGKDSFFYEKPEEKPVTTGSLMDEVEQNIANLNLAGKADAIRAEIDEAKLDQEGERLKINDFARGVNRAGLIDTDLAPDAKSELKGLGQSLDQLNSDPQVEISSKPLGAVRNNLRERRASLNSINRVDNANLKKLGQNEASLRAVKANLDVVTREMRKFIEKGLLDQRDSEEKNG